MNVRASIIAAVVAVMAIGGVASAHHATALSIEGDCRRVTVTVGYDRFGDGHRLHTLTTINGVAHDVDETPFGTGEVTYSYRFGGKGTVTVEAWAQNPDGSEEQSEHRTASRTFDLSCVHVAPHARFLGPCGDPMHAAVFDNRDSTVAVAFRFRFFSYPDGAPVSVWHTVKAGHTWTTPWKHVLGSSLMTVRAAGSMVKSKYAAAPGNYRPC